MLPTPFSFREGEISKLNIQMHMFTCNGFVISVHIIRPHSGAAYYRTSYTADSNI
jgi:hypothetical protein